MQQAIAGPDGSGEVDGSRVGEQNARWQVAETGVRVVGGGHSGTGGA